MDVPAYGRGSGGRDTEGREREEACRALSALERGVHGVVLRCERLGFLCALGLDALALRGQDAGRGQQEGRVDRDEGDDFFEDESDEEEGDNSGLGVGLVWSTHDRLFSILVNVVLLCLYQTKL